MRGIRIAERVRWSPGARLLALLVLVGLDLGCSPSPLAPALRTGPVYHHKQLGFRFLVPEGWKQQANSNLPEGVLDKEICLTKFRVPSTKGASLEVLCFDRSFAPDIAKYHAEPSQGVKDWQLDGELTDLDVEGAKGECLTLTAALPDGDKRTKNVTYFIRGERVFSFVAISTESDLKSREEMRRAVRSLVWEQ